VVADAAALIRRAACGSGRARGEDAGEGAEGEDDAAAWARGALAEEARDRAERDRAAQACDAARGGADDAEPGVGGGSELGAQEPGAEERAAEMQRRIEALQASLVDARAGETRALAALQRAELAQLVGGGGGGGGGSSGRVEQTPPAAAAAAERTPDTVPRRPAVPPLQLSPLEEGTYGAAGGGKRARGAAAQPGCEKAAAAAAAAQRGTWARTARDCAAQALFVDKTRAGAARDKGAKRDAARRRPLQVVAAAQLMR